MNKRLLIKLLLTAGVLIVLLIPLAMLDGLVAERQARGSAVAAEIARSSGGVQTVIGPMLLIEGVKTLRKQRSVSENGTLRQIEESERVEERRLLFPTSLKVEASANSERRSRGPFAVSIFHSKQSLSAEFAPPTRVPSDEDETDYRVKRVSLVLAIGDTRGIGAVQWRVNNQLLEVLPGGVIPGLPSGIVAELPSQHWQDQALQVEVSLSLAGTERLAWLPLADANQLALQSDWPHPGFSGAFLPSERKIDDAGFSAQWQVSRLASDAQQQLLRCLDGETGCFGLQAAAVGVNFVDPVDRYLMTERAIKYALLMLALVFGAVFFVEMLRALEVHVMQYGLTGLALAIFFLLLLALSEHLGFALAYGVAALACGSLISYYMSPALGGARATVGFSSLLFGLYLLLYFVLSAEDTALLVGSVALFGLLAAVMVMSRRLNWNRVGVAAND